MLTNIAINNKQISQTRRKRKMKLNKKALIVLIIYIGVIGLMIHDFVILTICHGQYTSLGLITLIVVLMIGNECETYLKKRLER